MVNIYPQSLYVNLQLHELHELLSKTYRKTTEKQNNCTFFIKIRFFSVTIGITTFVI